MKNYCRDPIGQLQRVAVPGRKKPDGKAVATQTVPSAKVLESRYDNINNNLSLIIHILSLTTCDTRRT